MGEMEPVCRACGAQLGAGPFCGDCGVWNGEGEPPPRPDRTCPVCGTVNSPGNRHCEGCAFRLDREPYGSYRASPLARLITAAAVVVFVVIVVIIFVRIVGGDGDATAASEGTSTTEANTDATTQPGAATAPATEAEQLRPSAVSASSSFSDALGPENLIDSDPATYWNDASLHGEGAELIFEFEDPVTIERLVIQNVADAVAFRRNYRVRGYEITTDDLPTPVIGELADTQDAQTIPLVTTATTRLTLRVTSTYQAESAGGQAPFEELAVAEVTVFGRTGPG